MSISSNWKKIFRFQEKSGWCGPAVIQMALLAGGIKKSQEEIAKEVYDEKEATPEKRIFSYLKKFYGKIGFKANSSVSDIDSYLVKNYLLIVDWWDNFDPADISGHYSLVLGHNKNTLTLGDPSSGRGIWDIKTEDFVSRWFDKTDDYDGWLLWLDPSSKV